MTVGDRIIVLDVGLSVGARLALIESLRKFDGAVVLDSTYPVVRLTPEVERFGEGARLALSRLAASTAIRQMHPSEYESPDARARRQAEERRRAVHGPKRGRW